MFEDAPGMMIPNGNYLKFFPDAELLETLPVSSGSGCLKIGAWLVIRKVIRHYKLEERIGGIIEKDSGMFFDLAAHAIVSENNAAQYYPDYAYNHPLFTDGMRIYIDSKVSGLLRDVSRDDSIEFQNEWQEGNWI